jgi:ABC-type dipeptide/oligopeptide/nickel transport system permease subunit
MVTKIAVKQFFSNKFGIAGSVILFIFLVMAVFAPLIAPYDPYSRVAEPFAEPSIDHLLGINDIGNDILSELIFGSRISLTIGLLSAIIAITIGSFIGLVAGFFGKHIDSILMRIVDLSLVIPMLPLMILLAAFIGPGFKNIIIVIGMLSWAGPARIIRSQVLTVRSRGYIEAVRAAGAGSWYIMFKHILPSSLSIIISQFILVASRSILIEASLSFLGLSDPTVKSWGIILYYAQSRSAFLNNSWLWWVLPTGLLITALVIGFAFVGNSLEEIVNPKLRRK